MTSIAKFVLGVCLPLAAPLFFNTGNAFSSSVVLAEGIHAISSFLGRQTSHHSGHRGRNRDYGTVSSDTHGWSSHHKKRHYRRWRRHNRGYSHGTHDHYDDYTGHSDSWRHRKRHRRHRRHWHPPVVDTAPGHSDPGRPYVPPPRSESELDPYPVQPSRPAPGNTTLGNPVPVVTTTPPGRKVVKPAQRTKRRGHRKAQRKPANVKTVSSTPSRAPYNPVDPLSPKNYVPNQVVIAAPYTNGRTDFYKVLSRKGYKLLSVSNYPNLDLAVSVYKVPKKYSVPKAIKRVRNMYPDITVDANHLYRLGGTETDGTTAVSPNKKELIAWGPVPGQCGKGLKIGLLDTEVEEKHSAFNGKQIVHKSFLPGGTTPAPKTHATAITSIWVANKTGLAPSARIYVASVFVRENKQVVNTRTKWLLSGLEWLIQNKVDVINLSFGGPVNKVFAKAISNAQSKGIVFVASAGNNGPGADPVYPAAHKNVIAVTAIDSKLQVYKQANQGDYIDFSAPGVNIRVAKPGEGEKVVSGTSFAAPYVAAAVALLKLRNQAGLQQKLKYLQTNSRDLGVKGKDKSYGWGLIQVKNACSTKPAVVAKTDKNPAAK